VTREQLDIKRGSNGRVAGPKGEEVTGGNVGLGERK